MMQDLISVNGNESLERCQLGNCVVDLPEDICEQRSLFREVLSEETWNSVLTCDQRNYLLKFLPKFSENDALNKQQTIRNLLSGENFRFGNPVDKFHEKLNAGHFTPNVTRMMLVMRKAKYRAYRHRQQRYFYKLLQDVLISRKRLMGLATSQPPDQPLFMERTSMTAQKSRSPFARRRVDSDASIQLRAKRRYARELQEIREEVNELVTSSDDDNYPDVVPPKLTKKQKKHFSQLEASLATEVGRVASTMAPKPQSFGSSHSHVVRSISPFEINDDDYRHMIAVHKRRRADTDFHLELDVDGITLQDIGVRTNIPKRSSKSSQSESTSKSKGNKDKDRKKGILPPSLTTIKAEPGLTPTTTGESSSDDPPLLIPKLEPLSSPVEGEYDNFNCRPDVASTAADSMVPTLNVVTCESSSSSSMVPPPLIDRPSIVDSNFGFALPRSSTPSVAHLGHSSFFSLLRDFFYETCDGKLLPSKLEDKVSSWQDSSFSTLKDWYLLHNNWVELVVPALKFLSGQVAAPVPDNFVPLIDYKVKLQYYHWSGEGRDSDEELAALSTFWLDARSAAAEERALCSEIADSSTTDSPPPPRVLTDWMIQATTDEEKVLYREQERRRYDNPHLAFTFCLHGYEAVVGPVKGVYGKDGSVAKAREHSLLVSDRPPFVTILSLVRDSASRLPNGEGTRADICELLKDSQFLAPATDVQIHTVVSGALDRLHYEKDPCVKYDVNRKMWIYLHRNRTEEEFERIHQAHATIVKTKKGGTKQKAKTTRSKSASRPASAMSTASSDSLLSLETSNTSIGGPSAHAGSFNAPTTSALSATPIISPATPKSRASSSNLKTGTAVTMLVPAKMNAALLPTTTPSPLAPPFPSTKISTVTSKSKLSLAGAQKVSKKRIPPVTTHMTSTLPAVPTTASSVVTKSTSSLTSKVTSALPGPCGTLCLNQPQQSSMQGLASTFKSVSQIVGRVDIPERVLQSTTETVSVLNQPVFTQHSSPRMSFTIPSTKIGVNTAHPLVSIAQVQLVCTTASSLPTMPVTVSTASAKLNATKQQPTTRPLLVNTHPSAVGQVRLVSSGTGAINQKSTTMSMPTIVIKQQDPTSPCLQVGNAHQQQATKVTGVQKPVVARIISSPQVVSVGSLIASTLAATQKQGINNVQGTTTIKIQGSNATHSVASKAAAHLNVLRSTPGGAVTGPGAMSTLHQVPRLAIVSQGNTGNLIPVSSATITVQPKLMAATPGQIGIVTSQHSQVSKPAILTTSAGIKIVSASTTSQLTSKIPTSTTQTLMMTGKPSQTPIVTVSVGTSPGTTPNLILTGTGAQTSSTTMPAVMIASRSLRPTSQTVMMAAQQNKSNKTSQPVFTRIITPAASLAMAMAAHHSGMSSTTGSGPAVTLRTSGTPGNLHQATIIRVQSPAQTPTTSANSQIDNNKDVR